MICNNCKKKNIKKANFCKYCGESLIAKYSKESEEGVILENGQNDNTYDESQNEHYSKDQSKSSGSNKNGFLKKITKGVGFTGLAVGGGLLSMSFMILQFLFVTVAGLSMIGLAISLFSEGSILLGLLTLFIGTPLAIGLANYFFIFFLFFTILTLIIWGLFSLFGFNVSFSNTWDIIWVFIKILVLGGMAFFGISAFIQAIKDKEMTFFIKENWYYIFIFFFLFWLFFLN